MWKWFWNLVRPCDKHGHWEQTRRRRMLRKVSSRWAVAKVTVEEKQMCLCCGEPLKDWEIVDEDEVQSISLSSEDMATYRETGEFRLS